VFMKVLFLGLMALTSLFCHQLLAASAPCDFKGISVGDKMTGPEVMKKLGVSMYSTNPKVPSLDEQISITEKYGPIASAEIVDEGIGPFCTSLMCKIPYGIYVGDNIPASVYIFFDEKNHQIQAIDIAVNSSNWDDLFQILKKKYGASWTVENVKMDISDFKDKGKNSIIVDRVIITHKTGGKNSKTQDSCEMFGTNYDGIFTHNSRLGVYQSNFEIKLISTNF